MQDGSGASEVSRSGYYDCLSSLEHPGKRASEDAQISQDITRIHASSRGTYGSPRIAASLRLEDKRSPSPMVYGSARVVVVGGE